MALFDRFKDEAEFRDNFVKPLLNRLGFDEPNSNMEHRSLAKILSSPNYTDLVGCVTTRRKSNT